MYDMYSEFNIEMHKHTYTDYLEVVIFPDGHIEYAVPSHQEKLIAVCLDKLGVSRYELENMCPREYYCDYMTWLCNMSGCVSVWSHYIAKSDKLPLTTEQINAINSLKEAKLLQLDQ